MPVACPPITLNKLGAGVYGHQSNHFDRLLNFMGNHQLQRIKLMMMKNLLEQI